MTLTQEFMELPTVEVMHGVIENAKEDFEKQNGSGYKNPYNDFYAQRLYLWGWLASQRKAHKNNYKLNIREAA